ncbi:MAG: WXG100 family type VII secretion target [Anaerolineae bacterium]|nr:WXG100 family type VII secretion target [Anaerolineae bacterium]
MSQAIASPEDIERFAQELKRFNEQLNDSMSRLQGQFKRLGDTWRDQEHQKFAREFEQTARVLQNFRRSSEQQIPFLKRKAQRLRDYLQQG